jgi:hypothetical protein
MFEKSCGHECNKFITEDILEFTWTLQLFTNYKNYHLFMKVIKSPKIVNKIK